MNFTAEQLQENFDKLISYIDKYFEGDRKEQLKKLYMDHEERLLLMPASGNINYHNCFPGGYVDHVIRVIDMAITVNEVWESYGANMNHTQEELIFAALNHDLGKIGTEQAETFKGTVSPLLQSLAQTLQQGRESADGAARGLAGEGVDQPMAMGSVADAGLGNEMPAAPMSDLDSEEGDAFGAVDAAAGGDAELGRERR